MDGPHNFQRREFLRISAAGAASTMLAACGGTAPTVERNPTPTSGARRPAVETAVAGEQAATPDATGGPAPAATGVPESAEYVEGATYSGEFGEAPALAAMVEDGTLPPVERRLPARPYVVPHPWLSEGRYGGTMRWLCSDVWGTTHFVQESMYGHSIVRWLEDGLAVGPGLAESWESNEDQSEWTFNFRVGLRWSDGHPWTVDDILFWWEDEVLDEDVGELPPDDMFSGTGTLGEMRKVDDHTLQIVFDAPTPLLPERLAMWVNRGIGPRWMDPRHYMEQFHIKYNERVDKETWTETFSSKLDWAINPESPTMTGWKLRTYREGQFSEWERNPYYWCIDQQGNQLPYLDRLRMNYFQNPEVLRLQIQQGTADFVHGGFIGLTLGDVSGIRRSEARSRMEVRLWDSGSGTGSIFFFSQDYKEPEMRALIRDSRFRKALSHAYNREEVRRSIYFNQGELTTGTYSPKTIEFFVGDGPQVYKEWRDSAVRYDPDLAKRMLDELGVVDEDGDGRRELPGGGKLEITLDYSAPGSSEHVRKNQLLARDWNAIGVRTRLNPVPAEGFADRWARGELMTTTAWECSGSLTFVPSMLWLMPMEPTRWAPLQGQWYAVRGTAQARQELDEDPYERTPPRMEPEPGGPIDRLWKLYDRARVETDAVRRNRLVWEMVRIHIDEGPFFMGAVANFPQIEVVKRGLRNVPQREELARQGFVNDWEYPTPAAYDPEAWYWDDPASRS